jgi:uncharacterized protein YjbI with pentapeptide repeats
MPSQNRNSWKLVTLMAVAAIGAIAFAGWAIWAAVNNHSALLVTLTSLAGVGSFVAGVLVIAGPQIRRPQNQLQHQPGLPSYNSGPRQQSQPFTERLTAATRELADPNHTIRVAGVYNLAALADDWEDRRQDCIDILCATLCDQSSPATAPSHATVSPIRDVRHAILNIIAAHLQSDNRRQPAHTDWSNYNFSFTGITFDGADFANARFNGLVKFCYSKFASGATVFNNAQFLGAGRIDFTGAQFTGGGVTFSDCLFAGGSKIDFTDVQVNGGHIGFEHSEFSGGDVHFVDARFSRGTVSFADAKFSGADVFFALARFAGCTVTFYGAEFTGGTVDFSSTQFGKGNVEFGSMQLKGGVVRFPFTTFGGSSVHFGAAKFIAGTMEFSSAKFIGGVMAFPYAQFKGGNITFSWLEFEGGIVDFSEAGDWTKPPVFTGSIATALGLQLPQRSP